MLNDLSDVRGDSSLSMITDGPGDDNEYDAKRNSKMNGTQSSYSKQSAMPSDDWGPIPSPTKASKVSLSNSQISSKHTPTKQGYQARSPASKSFIIDEHENEVESPQKRVARELRE